MPARIISVVDAFDVVTETRPYHAGESIVRAMDELRWGRGTQFDPHVVDAFFEGLNMAQREAI
jgi:HD-GYP domain-containing protein (c-di-GMP phosphodiesterase class II)